VPDAAVAPVPGPDEMAAAHGSPGARSGELSGLRLLLAQLDQLLRDPTLTLALKRFAARLSGGARDLAAAIANGLRALLRLPRWLLLGLLALLLPLALLALLSSAGDDGPGSQPADIAGAGMALPGVGMPALAASQQRPEAVRVALVLDRSYDAPALRRELRALGTWLGENHAAGTRVTVIDARSARASAPLRPSELASGRALQAQDSTRAAVRSALGGPRDRRLLVTLGSPAPAPAATSTLSIATRPGASAPASRSGARSRVAIDDRRPNALAASIARGIMGVSGQREPR